MQLIAGFKKHQSVIFRYIRLALGLYLVAMAFIVPYEAGKDFEKSFLAANGDTFVLDNFSGVEFPAAQLILISEGAFSAEISLKTGNGQWTFQSVQQNNGQHMLTVDSPAPTKLVLNGSADIGITVVAEVPIMLETYELTMAFAFIFKVFLFFCGLAFVLSNLPQWIIKRLPKKAKETD